jgi:hypothetical protein
MEPGVGDDPIGKAVDLVDPRDPARLAYLIGPVPLSLAMDRHQHVVRPRIPSVVVRLRRSAR